MIFLQFQMISNEEEEMNDPLGEESLEVDLDLEVDFGQHRKF